MTTWLLLVAFTLQPTADHRAVVVAAKAAAMAAGVNPDALAPDECARWEITRRVAWELRSEGAGLIAKGGNNCRGYAVDAIMYPDGTVVDILGAGVDGPNTAHWFVQPVRRPASDWRAPIDLDPDTPPAPVQDETLLLLQRVMAELETLRLELAALRAQQTADTEKVQSQIDQVVKNAEKSAPSMIERIAHLVTLGCLAK
jgi:hypothetical protein